VKKFTFWRNAIIAETYEFEAESEEEAREMLRDGQVEVMSEEFIDWATDDYQLEHVEIVDPLYRMVKDHKLVDT
jgi:hypothetical protein